MINLKSFFSPKSIAIVGASPKKEKLGNILAENIKKGDWKGNLYFVNPKYAKSKKGYFSSLCEIKKPVDLVLIAIPAPFVNKTIKNGAKARPAIKNFAVISSGFKESGAEGKKLEENLEKIARNLKLNILGPNCLGFTNPIEKLNATFTDVKLKPANIAIVSQSGALAVALLDWAEKKKIGFSKIISIGNKTVIGESDILNFLANDSDTKVIALYLESIKNGSQFMQALAKITPRKPVIILKAGKTAAGQKAVSSHTGSLAQDEEVIKAVFEKLNVISANTIEEFQDIVYYLSSNPVPIENEVIVVTNAGGPGVMASDFVGKSKSIKLLNFPPDFHSEIKKDLPASASVENPIDLIGDATPQRYKATLSKISRKFNNSPILVLLTPQNQTDPAKVAQFLAKMKNRVSNLSACFMGGEKITLAEKVLDKYDIPSFENPERALLVFEKLSQYQQKRTSVININQIATIKRSNRAAKKILPGNRKILFWKEAEKLFRIHGIRLAHTISFENLADIKNKKIPFPCALKTDDPSIAHRLEKNAVILNIQNAKELYSAFAKIKKATKAGHFLIQEMAPEGLELIIGMKHDSSFGSVVLCGLGGSFTEIFRDKTILIPPFNQIDIRKKLSQLAIFPILKGFRGKRGYNLGEISKIIAVVAQIALENPEIREIDINPLVVYNNGKNGQILDAKFFLI